MKCYEIIEYLEEVSPKSFAESWDNVGLLCGREEKEVSSLYIALDATKEVIEEAKRVGADMLLTHHPMIFRPLKQVSGSQTYQHDGCSVIAGPVSLLFTHV